MAINNITGSPVEGENFFGREKELEYAWNHIKKGNSIVLSAPRRVGKSSFAKKLLEIAKEKKWNTIEINLEEAKSEEGFIKLFIEKIKEENWWKRTKEDAKQIVGKILEEIKIEYNGTSIEWKRRKENIFESMKKMLDHKEETLIMIDEVTILLNNLIKDENGSKNVEEFLNWLRSFRQVSGTKIRWVFCSSIGIENFVSINKISYTFNDVKTYHIDEFKKGKAEELLKELAISDNIVLPEGFTKKFLNLLQWYLPYFVQVLYSNYHELITVQEFPNSISTLNKSYKVLIESKELNTWEERLREYKEYEQYARIMLKNVSLNKKGVSKETIRDIIYKKTNDIDITEGIVNKLDYMLKNDGYLVFTKNYKYKFRSPLLRDFWFNRFAR